MSLGGGYCTFAITTLRSPSTSILTIHCLDIHRLTLLNMKFLALSALAGFAAAGTTQQRILGDVDRFSSAIYPIPPLGFGTWNLKGDNTSDVVAAALKTGYRHIDAASAYSNQKSVGKGIKAGMKASNLKRKDIWVTSKLWNDQ